MKNKKVVWLLAFMLVIGIGKNCPAVEMEEQIKFDVDDPKTFDAIKDQPKILSYKVKHSDEYIYEDYYYDTPDLALYNLGFSFAYQTNSQLFFLAFHQRLRTRRGQF